MDLVSNLGNAISSDDRNYLLLQIEAILPWSFHLIKLQCFYKDESRLCGNEKNRPRVRNRWRNLIEFAIMIYRSAVKAIIWLVSGELFSDRKRQYSPDIERLACVDMSD